jgi:hypothetical protein
MIYENIWVADERKAKAIFKRRVYNYITDINIGSDGILFTNDGNLILYKDVKDITLGRQRIAYWSYFIGSLLVFLSTYSKTRSLAYSTIPLLIGIILGLCIGWVFQYWVIITYLEKGKLKKVYIAPSGASVFHSCPIWRECFPLVPHAKHE